MARIESHDDLAADVTITIGERGAVSFEIRESIPEFLCFDAEDMHEAINALVEGLRKALMGSCREHLEHNKERRQ